MRCSPASRKTLQIEGEQDRGFPSGGKKVRKGVQTKIKSYLQEVNSHLIASTFLLAAAIHTGYLPLYPVAIGYWMMSINSACPA